MNSFKEFNLNVPTVIGINNFENRMNAIQNQYTRIVTTRIVVIKYLKVKKVHYTDHK